MKELTIERKAKAYDEAIKRAKALYDNEQPISGSNVIINNIFPELIESEDERIRKEIYWFFTQPDTVCDKRWIAWLEKQKAVDVLDAEEREFADNVNSYRKDMDEFYKKGYDAGREAEKQYWLEKQDEQKPQGKSALEAIKEEKVDNANKVEPKFKVGDFVVHDMSDGKKIIRQIINMTNKSYVLDGEGFNTFYFRNLENEYHLWTIQDAKDGDVLADNVGVILFKNIGDNNVINFHAYFSGLFAVQEGEHYWGHIRECTLSPATKIQCERFFAAMHDAGYEWDAEKKELKRIEQNPIDCNEEYYNEELKSALFTSLRDAREQYLREKNAAWSEEDMSKVQRICKYLNEAKKYYADITEVRECMDWLKSLEDRYTWKPSDEQMNDLKIAIDSFTFEKDYLQELYEDLKKLRGK